MWQTWSDPPAPRRPGQGGFTLLEVISAMAIMALALTSIHLTIGSAVRSKLFTSSWIRNQAQGRLIVAWVADRVRQAGFRVDGSSPVARCRDPIAAQDPAYRPTDTQLYVNADVDNDGAPETRGFTLATVGGRTVLQETIIPCAVGASPVVAPLTDVRHLHVQSLDFDYYDAAGTPLGAAALTTVAGIRAIRTVRVQVRLEADAGAQGATTQTWSTHVWLRNR